MANSCVCTLPCLPRSRMWSAATHPSTQKLPVSGLRTPTNHPKTPISPSHPSRCQDANPWQAWKPHPVATNESGHVPFADDFFPLASCRLVVVEASLGTVGCHFPSPNTFLILASALLRGKVRREVKKKRTCSPKACNHSPIRSLLAQNCPTRNIHPALKTNPMALENIR